MDHVFISHGSEDRDEAVALCALVESHGVTAWIAPRDVRPGGDYSEALQAAIEGCAAFVVLVTDTANKSPYVRAETEMAFSNGKPIFPVRTSDIKPGAGLAFFLKIRHWTDAFGKDRDASLERLALELRTLTGVAPEVPPAPTPAPVPVPAAPAPAEAARSDPERLAAAVGPRANLYLERWRRMDGKKSSIGWNWAACLANVYWLAYRKLWLWFAVTAFAIVALAVIGGLAPRLGMATLLATIAISFVTGTFGDHLYAKHVHALAADPSLDLAGLAKRGGVSMPALIGAIAATFAAVAIAVVVAAQQMPPQPDPQPGPQPAPAPSSQDLLIGRWAEDGNCADAVEFTADGRFTTTQGAAGTWSLADDQLTLSGPGGTQTVQLVQVDQNALSIATDEGPVQTSQRC